MSLDRDFGIVLELGANTVESLKTFFENVMVADIKAAFLTKFAPHGASIEVSSWKTHVDVSPLNGGLFHFDIGVFPVFSQSFGEDKTGDVLMEAIADIESTVRPKLEALGVTIHNWHSH